MADILYRELSYLVVGAAMEVHRELGPGFLEAVYKRALAIELWLRDLPFEQFVRLSVAYKGSSVGDYTADFVVDRKIAVELKAAAALHPRHQAQAADYLASSGLRLAILLNFGADSLEYRRVVR